MKPLLNMLFPWPAKIKAMEAQLETAQSELESARSELTALKKKHIIDREGIGVLLQFIHRSHRLDMPFLENTIRTALQRSQ